jgi:hypothetical protein
VFRADSLMQTMRKNSGAILNRAGIRSRRLQDGMTVSITIPIGRMLIKGIVNGWEAWTE